MELFHASAQWASRPSDERFASLEEMHAQTKAYADSAREKTLPWSDLRVEAQGDNLSLIGKAGIPATLTNYAFRQIAARVKAPAGYLETLPATLAAQNINHGLKARTDGEAQLLFHENGQLLLRAATSERYARIWNHEVVARLIDTATMFDLKPAIPTMRFDGQDPDTAGDLHGDKRPALFASDHDMFAFLMSRDRVIRDPVGAELFRGVFVKNSEVGDAALSIMGFNFRDVCGNFIVWGAREIEEISLRHVGDIRGRWAQAVVNVRKYLDGAASIEEAKMVEMTRVLALTKDEALDLVFGKRIDGLTRKVLSASYDAVVPSEDGNPNTVWGLAQGITRHSQETPYADVRNQLDRAAGKLLDLVF